MTLLKISIFVGLILFLLIVYLSADFNDYKININGCHGIVTSHVYGNVYNVLVFAKEDDLNIILQSYSDNREIKEGANVVISEINGKYYIN